MTRKKKEKKKKTRFDHCHAEIHRHLRKGWLSRAKIASMVPPLWGRGAIAGWNGSMSLIVKINISICRSPGSEFGS
jgi:hypothetical protein